MDKKLKKELKELLENTDKTIHSQEEIDILSDFIENSEKYTYPKKKKNWVIKDMKWEKQHTVPKTYLN